MDFVFFPVEDRGLHNFGLAILSKFPLQDTNFDWLPSLYPILKPRKRGAIKATIHTPIGPVRIFNTHLSLFKLERRKQIKALLSKRWLRSVSEDDPVIFCGDLNAGSTSAVYHKLTRKLIDVQKTLNNKALPQSTFHSQSPLFRIDHILISKHFKVNWVKVPKTPKIQMLSDHLPLITELILQDN
jgi:endonuclease/exonuclease/phosphatase family metal-dependent hydrolase